MIGYDFDKTIYDGDSSTNFFFFMLKKRPYLILLAPYFLVIISLYGLKILSKKKVKELLFFYLRYEQNVDKLVKKFWDKNESKIFEWYKNQQREDDIIISASLLFLIEPIMKRLGIKHYSATNFDLKTAKIIGENCYGQEKVARFNKMNLTGKLEVFYSDSMSDKPMFKLAKKSYLVKNKKPQEIKL